jgi:Ni,Fe-hydrogenase III large subunit
MDFPASAIIRAAPAASCRPWPRHVLPASDWAAMAASLAGEPTLVLRGLWADPTDVHALLHDTETDTHLPVSVAAAGGGYAALSPHRPDSAWFERMVADLWGHRAIGGTDVRPWLDHGKWPLHTPLGSDPQAPAGTPEPPALLPCTTENMFQIPLGPVLPGIAEAAHLRLSVAGETIARAEFRLGYLHKGTLGLMRGKPPRIAARYAARLSGDSTVAHGIAFARAAEEAAQTEAPPRAAALRDVMAELERLANHFADCAAIADAAGFAPPQAGLLGLREAVLVAAARIFGHRLMMDVCIPGGLVADVPPDTTETILALLGTFAREGAEPLRLCHENRLLADRAGGVAGVHLYRRLADIPAAIARLRDLVTRLPEGPIAVSLPMGTGEGIGRAAGHRGDIFHWLRLEGGQIAAAFLCDPSWLLWPRLEAALQGANLEDAGLITAAFACSVSGVDL